MPGDNGISYPINMTMPIDVKAAINAQNKHNTHSISSANTYRQCPRLYYNRYVLGYEELGEPSWLTFGSKVDRLLEVLDNSNLEAAIAAIPNEFSDPFDQADIEILLCLWQKQYGVSTPLKPLDLNGKPGSQYPVYVPFCGNDVTGMLSMTVSGRIDKVTVIEGEVGVFEGKTTGKAIEPNSIYWKKLDMDPQIAAYTWGLSKELGKPVNWVWYQVIRRPNYAANTNFKRTYTRKGVEYAFTLAEYRARLETILQGDNEKTLIARKKIFIGEARKEEWITEHAQTYQEIQAKRQRSVELVEAGHNPELAWPRNHLGCDMYGGCPFWECCIGKTTIEGSGKFQLRKGKQ